MELMVAMVLLVMIAGALAGLVLPSYRAYSDGKDLSRARLIGQSVAAEIEGRLLYAQGVEPVTDPASIRYTDRQYGPMAMSVGEDGRLSIAVGETDIAYDTLYYMNMTVAVVFGYSEGDAAVQVSVQVLTSGGEAVYKTERIVPLLNIGAG